MALIVIGCVCHDAMRCTVNAPICDPTCVRGDHAKTRTVRGLAWSVRTQVGQVSMHWTARVSVIHVVYEVLRM